MGFFRKWMTMCFKLTGRGSAVIVYVKIVQYFSSHRSGNEKLFPLDKKGAPLQSRTNTNPSLKGASSHDLFYHSP